jgi:hypothetical protein
MPNERIFLYLRILLHVYYCFTHVCFAYVYESKIFTRNRLRRVSLTFTNVPAEFFSLAASPSVEVLFFRLEWHRVARLNINEPSKSH